MAVKKKKFTARELQLLLDLINNELLAVKDMSPKDTGHGAYAIDLLHLKRKVQAQ